MFYNITDDTIEDFSGFGLADLEKRIARTPLPPLETFLDDPLRVLRTIRFASRYSLEIHPDIVASFAVPEIKLALDSKVSRERILKEFSLMMTGVAPYVAMQIIWESEFLDSILVVPEG